MDRIHISSPWKNRLSTERLDTVEGVLSLRRGEPVAQSRTTRTTRVTALSGQGPALFIKIYTFPSRRDLFRGLLRGILLGRPRAQREWIALKTMRQAGLPGVEPVAWGLRRRNLFVRSAFLITREESPDAQPLDKMLLSWQREHVPPARQRHLITALARSTRSMHETGFVSGDCFLRNIIAVEEAGTCRFSFLDCPKARFSRRTAPLCGKALLDLASLDAGAKLLVSRSDRLRFLRAYMNVSKLTEDMRRSVRRILRLERRIEVRERARIEARSRQPCPS